MMVLLSVGTGKWEVVAAGSTTAGGKQSPVSGLSTRSCSKFNFPESLSANRQKKKKKATSLSRITCYGVHTIAKLIRNNVLSCCFP